MIEIKIIPDSISFDRRIVFFKDGKQLTSFNYEILDDLTFKSPEGNPFEGPEFSIDDAILELSYMIKNDNPEELKDTSVEEIIEVLKPITEHHKIKQWKGDFLPPFPY